jgi:hypothetical protein
MTRKSNRPNKPKTRHRKHSRPHPPTTSKGERGKRGGRTKITQTAIPDLDVIVVSQCQVTARMINGSFAPHARFEVRVIASTDHSYSVFLHSHPATLRAVHELRPGVRVRLTGVSMCRDIEEQKATYLVALDYAMFQGE